jgi:hypothetical protein
MQRANLTAAKNELRPVGHHPTVAVGSIRVSEDS